MKKIVVLLILSLSVMGILSGCAKKNDDDNGDNVTPTPEVTNDEQNEPEIKEDDIEDDIEDGTEDGANAFVPIENPVAKEDYDYNAYIKLGKYKGIEVKVKQQEITDEDIDVSTQMELYDNGIEPIEVTDRAVKFGDTINIDFVGYHNGEPFEGGSAEAYELTIGSKALIEGFEEQLIGAELNKETDINVVFPENYGNEALSGEPAIFKVKVNGIRYFELTEDFVKDVMGFDSEEAYRESIRQELIAANTDMLNRQKENEVYTAVIGESEITLPDNLLEYYESDIKTQYTNIAASYGTTLENFLNMSQSSLEEFDTIAKSYSDSMATRELVIKAISIAEGIELTEEEFQAGVAKYVEQYGYESAEAFLEEADADVIREDLLFNKIIDFLVAEAIEI